MERKIVPIKAINRSNGIHGQDGDLEELINLRHKGGYLRPSGEKQKAWEYPTTLTAYDILYRHPSLPPGELIGSMLETGKVYRIKPTGISEIFTLKGAAISPTGWDWLRVSVSL